MSAITGHAARFAEAKRDHAVAPRGRFLRLKRAWRAYRLRGIDTIASRTPSEARTRRAISVTRGRAQGEP